MRIQLHSLHGLFRAKDLEIGRDADNGGQIVYVMELARALSERPEVTKVDLFTRRVDDPLTGPDYARPVETVTPKLDIRRISFGGKRYLPKEKLWPHLDEYVANAIIHIKQEKIFPDWLHGHYADGGYVANELSAMLNVPFCQTGHSLGRPKLRKLLESGWEEAEAYRRFQFARRFAAEDTSLVNAEFIVTSTSQEIETYRAYPHFDCAEFHVIPPGIDFDRYFPYYQDLLGHGEVPTTRLQAKMSVRQSLERFLTHPERPFILALCRPDKKKNIDGLLHAYGTDKALQAVANLVIFAGIRSDIESMPEGEREVLTDLLLLMDKYNLYGKLAIPKRHDAEWDVPEAYRFCAERKGVFINIALTEPFGLTLLEATACGCPVVATSDGGPAEILPRCGNGILVPPEGTPLIQQALRDILVDESQWTQLSNQGVSNIREHFSWDAHVARYLELVSHNRQHSAGLGRKNLVQNPKLFERLRTVEHLIVTDVDGTLISETGDYAGLDALKAVLSENTQHFAFGVATGRSLQSVRQLFERYGMPLPDVVICDVGSRINYGFKDSDGDKAWMDHIDFRWNAGLIRDKLAKVIGLKPQEAEFQTAHKVSYYLQPEAKSRGFDLAALRAALGKLDKHVNLIITHGSYLDILPRRASKGRAIRFLCNKWSIPLSQTIVFGDAGNDLDMFTGATRGVVVGNHSPEMEALRGSQKVYFSPQASAAGVLDGLAHFQLISPSL